MVLFLNQLILKCRRCLSSLRSNISYLITFIFFSFLTAPRWVYKISTSNTPWLRLCWCSRSRTAWGAALAVCRSLPWRQHHVTAFFRKTEWRPCQPNTKYKDKCRQTGKVGKPESKGMEQGRDTVSV